MGWAVNTNPRPLYPQQREPIRSVQEAEWAPAPVWTGTENLAPQQRFNPRKIQSVASRYTEYTITDGANNNILLFLF